MGGDKESSDKKTVDMIVSTTSTAKAEAGAREKLLARKRKMSDVSNSNKSHSSSKSKSNSKSNSNKNEGPINKDSNKDIVATREKSRKRSERRRQGRQNVRMTNSNNNNDNNNRPPERGRDNNRGFRDDYFRGDRRRGPPPPGYGRGMDGHRGGGGRGGYDRGFHHNMPPGHFDPYGRPPDAFHGPPRRGRGRQGPPHPPNNGRGGFPPGRWGRGGGMDRPFPRGPPQRTPHGRSMSPHNPHGHRHNHRGREHGRNDHHCRSSSRRGRSHDSASSHSSRSRSLSRSSYSSNSSEDSYSSDDDEHSRSHSNSHSRSPSPKNQENKDQQLDKVENKTSKEAEEKSPSSKTSSSHGAKRNRSRSTSKEGDSRRNRSHHRGRRRSHSSLSDRSHSRSSRSFSTSSQSHSSTSSRYSNDDDDDHKSDYSGNDRGDGGRRMKERRRKRRRHNHRGSSRRNENSAFSKDQRTVFVSQLVMRTTERDIKKYFKKKVGCKVQDVSLIRDRRNARHHKGCAYVEVGRIEDVAKAVAVSGQPPDFQRFPILIKGSEAEKNYTLSDTAVVADATTAINIDTAPGTMSAIAIISTDNNKNNSSNVMSNQKQWKNSLAFLPPLKDENGNRIESQKVYVGGLSHAVTEKHLFALFSQFGRLLKVQLQLDLNTRVSRGYAFLSFHDPKVSNLAIQTMAGKTFADGRPLKTGWANQSSSFSSRCTIVTSDELPDDGAALSQKALGVLDQMTGGAGNTAEQEANKAVIGVTSSSGSNDAPIDSTIHATAAVELSKAMMVPSKPSTSSGDIATAEEELDKAMGLLPFTNTSTSGGNKGVSSASAIPTVAEARASFAATVAARQLAAATVSNDAATAASKELMGNADKPTRHLLVHNMYDKDKETDQGWEKDVKEEFIEECSKFGKIENVTVMHEEPGGKIYASFVDSTGAKACAENLAGRWFDQRQLRVDYMQEENIPIVK